MTGLAAKPHLDLFGFRPEQVEAIKKAQEHYRTYGQLEWPDGRELTLKEAKAEMQRMRDAGLPVNKWTGEEVTYIPETKFDINAIPPKPERAKMLHRCPHCLTYFWRKVDYNVCIRDCGKRVNDQESQKASQKKAANK